MLSRIVLRFFVGVALALAALAPLAWVVLQIGDPSTLSVLRAESEIARFRVANPTAASFPISGFKLFDDGALDGRCAADAIGRNSALEPALNAMVRYRIGPGGRIAIDIEAAAGQGDGAPRTALLRGIDAASGQRRRLAAVGDLLELEQDPDCGSVSARRLPIWGPGEIGGVPTFRGDGPTPTLLNGALDIYGRASQSSPLALFGVIDQRRLLAADNRALYASGGSSLQIPPGSRISTEAIDNGEEGADPSLRVLRGFATPGEGRFRIDVSTEAEELYFYPPGAGKSAERIRMSRLSQLANDPNLQLLFQVIVWFIVVLPIALELVRPLFARSDENW